MSGLGLDASQLAGAGGQAQPWLRRTGRAVGVGQAVCRGREMFRVPSLPCVPERSCPVGFAGRLPRSSSDHASGHCVRHGRETRVFLSATGPFSPGIDAIVRGGPAPKTRVRSVTAQRSAIAERGCPERDSSADAISCGLVDSSGSTFLPSVVIAGLSDRYFPLKWRVYCSRLAAGPIP